MLFYVWQDGTLHFFTILKIKLVLNLYMATSCCVCIPGRVKNLNWTVVFKELQ